MSSKLNIVFPIRLLKKGLPPRKCIDSFYARQHLHMQKETKIDFFFHDDSKKQSHIISSVLLARVPELIVLARRKVAYLNASLPLSNNIKTHVALTARHSTL